MTDKQELVVLLGAGASAHVGVPMTPALTTEVVQYPLKGIVKDRLLWMIDPRFKSPLSIPAKGGDFDAIDRTKQAPDFSQTTAIYQAVLDTLKTRFDSPNFEHILAALEDLEAISSTQQNKMVDDFRAVIAPFVTISPNQPMFSQPIFLHIAIEELVKLISKIFQKKLAQRANPEAETKAFFEVLRNDFRVSVFNLNYDNLLELSGFPLEDGFIDNRGDFKAFSIKAFQHALSTGKELHCHLHGSLLYGYPRSAPDLMSQLVKYPNPALALQALEGIGVSGTNVKGSNVTGRPLISGFNKLSKLHYSAAPYRAYFRAFGDCLARNKRLLIVGYGGYDDHINSLIREYMSKHGQDKRVAYILPRHGKDIGRHPTNGDRLMLEMSHPTDFGHSRTAYYDATNHPVEFSTYGNLALCAAGFPLQKPESLGKIIDFLKS